VCQQLCIVGLPTYDPCREVVLVTASGPHFVTGVSPSCSSSGCGLRQHLSVYLVGWV